MRMQRGGAPGLIADIGGTNARFSLIVPDRPEGQQPLVLSCADYSGLAEATEAYLEKVAPPVRPDHGAFAIASPVQGDEVHLTNRDWRFSISELRQRLGFAQLELVNDFTAVALAVPLLSPEHQVAIGGGTPVFGAPVAVLGPGTGLGVAALIPFETGWQPVATEGGHATMAAATEQEAGVLDRLRRRFGHASAERVLSGPGLVNLYQSLADLSGETAQAAAPHQVTDLAERGDPLAADSLAMFFAMLGTFAGNLALTLGARGGVVIAGGIIPHLLGRFAGSGFRERFEDKGRFRSYLAAIPVHVITHPYPAFVGLRGLLG